VVIACPIIEREIVCHPSKNAEKMGLEVLYGDLSRIPAMAARWYKFICHLVFFGD